MGHHPPRPRFIPAGAGNTTSGFLWAGVMTVHPCRRREHCSTPDLERAIHGSSLQAQGTPDQGVQLLLDGRFIPAGAGNTSSGVNLSIIPPVHPCRRREHRSGTNDISRGVGSSLQAQGTLASFLPVREKGRFIPAGAGNTVMNSMKSVNNPVHPCRRREHVVLSTSTVVSCGSSLQAQGTRIDIQPEILSNRFIPAGAGNTGSSLTWRRQLSVHPCRRREHTPGVLQIYAHCGSSLQAQGTLGMRHSLHSFTRFIPAGAGNTSSGH